MMATRTLGERIEQVRERIAEAAIGAGRAADEITLVAVTKTADRAAIDDAYTLGIRHFGENRVQDAGRRYEPPLPADACLHMIGQLQTNKVRPALNLFSLIESVDRPSLVRALAQEAERRRQPVPVLVQVNIAGEAQKAGCAPAQAATLIAEIRQTPWLQLRGLMTIAPLVEDPEEVRPVFAGLRALRDRLRAQDPSLPLATLSMGMTDDFPVAIAEGATEVRIGRAIFQP